MLLQEELESLKKKVASLEKEVSVLKQQMTQLEVTPPVERVQRKQITQTKQEPIIHKKEQVLQQAVQVSEPVRKQSQTKQPPPKISFEELLKTWMPRVFMFILLLGVLWGLKLGMDYGLITYGVRIGLGYGVTVLLYVLGMRHINAGKKGFGLTLLGGLIVIGMLTTFAAHFLYDLFHVVIAFMIGVFYIAVGLILAKRTHSEILTIFAAIGGFLLPFLINEGEANTLLFACYILALFLSLLYVSITEKHKMSFYVTFILFHLTLGIYTLVSQMTNDENIIVTVIAIQHLVILYIYLRGFVTKQVAKEVIIYSNFVLMAGWVKLLDYSGEITVYGVLAGLYVLLAVYLLKKHHYLHGVVMAVAVFAVSIFILAFQMDERDIKLILLLINGAIGYWVGFRYQSKRTVVISLLIYSLTVLSVLSFVDVEEFFSLAHLTWFLFIITLGSLYFTTYQYGLTHWKLVITKIDQALIGLQIAVIIYLLHLTNLIIVKQQIFYETALHVYAFVLIVVLFSLYFLHLWERGMYVARAVVVQFLLLGVVMLFSPLHVYSEENWFLFRLSVQIFYILFLTLLFIVVHKGSFFYQGEALKKAAPTWAFVMQIAYFLVINKWYLALAEFYDWNQDYVYVIQTLYLFMYAFVSISIGKKRNWQAVKVSGVVLVLLCIIKLFFFDLAAISLAIRAIIFILVGVVGLIYSRMLLKSDD